MSTQVPSKSLIYLSINFSKVFTRTDDAWHSPRFRYKYCHHRQFTRSRGSSPWKCYFRRIASFPRCSFYRVFLSLPHCAVFSITLHHFLLLLGNIRISWTRLCIRPNWSCALHGLAEFPYPFFQTARYSTTGPPPPCRPSV